MYSRHEEYSVTTVGPLAPLTGAQILVEALVANGTDTVFGLPGDTGVAFYDALLARRADLSHILARDERHAVYMADAYARISGGTGVVEVSSGGGVMYAVGGLGEAYAASTPILVLTTDIDTSSVGTGALTEINQEELFRAVSKWCQRAGSAQEIPGLVAQALHHATDGRPGPTVLIVPEDVLDDMASPPAPFPGAESATYQAPRTSEMHHDLVRKAAKILDSSRRPAILAGAGVHASRAYETLAILSEALQAPVATTIHGKGVVSESGPLWMGIAGNNGATPGTNEGLARADALVIVGSRANATDTDGWAITRGREDRIIQIDIDADRCGRNFPGCVPLVGDAKGIMEELLQYLSPQRALNRAWHVNQTVRDSRLAVHSRGRDNGVMATDDVIRLLNRYFDEEVPMLGDPGTPTPHLASLRRQRRPHRSVLLPRGHGPMGYAIPAAIGASLATNRGVVVCVTADGSFAMSCGELETVRRLNLPLLILELNNNSLGWIKMLQHLYYDRRYYQVDPGPIDSAAVATATGIRGHDVTNLSELSDVIEVFMNDHEPTFVSVPVAHMIDRVPPVSSWLNYDAKNPVRPVY